MKNLLPSVIHGIITEICDINIYKKGTLGGRTFTLGGRTLESNVTHTFLTPPANPVQFFWLKMPSKCLP